MRWRDKVKPVLGGCALWYRASQPVIIESNDISRDEHGRLYLIDRWGAGMHILEYTG